MILYRIRRLAADNCDEWHNIKHNDKSKNNRKRDSEFKPIFPPPGPTQYHSSPINIKLKRQSRLKTPNVIPVEDSDPLHPSILTSIRSMYYQPKIKSTHRCNSENNLLILAKPSLSNRYSRSSNTSSLPQTKSNDISSIENKLPPDSLIYNDQLKKTLADRYKKSKKRIPPPVKSILDNRSVLYIYIHHFIDFKIWNKK